MSIISGKRKILRESRTLLGLTQRQVAERANIPLQNYQRFECGERDICSASFTIACRVIEALEMNISDFYHQECLHIFVTDPDSNNL